MIKNILYGPLVLCCRAGSTIADYTFRAPSIFDDKVQQVKVGIFNTLAEKNYSVEFVSKETVK